MKCRQLGRVLERKLGRSERIFQKYPFAGCVARCRSVTATSLELGDQSFDVLLLRHQRKDVNIVTSADIQRVAKKYFSDTNRYVFYYLPESERTKSDSASGINAKGGQGR